MKTCRTMGLGVALVAITLLTGAILPDDRALLDAIKRSDVAAVRSLLKEGADANAAQGDGLTALHLAAQEGNLEITKLVLSAGAKVEAKTRIGEYTPLHLASAGAHLSVVQALLAAGASPKTVTTNSGVTPLHLAARALDGAMVVRVLLEKGAAIDARETSAGQTALMFASSFGRTATVRELLSHGADASLQTTVVDVLKHVAVDKAAEERLKAALKDLRTPGMTRELTPAEEQKAVEAQRAFLASKEEVQKVIDAYTDGALNAKRPTWNTPSGYRSKVVVDSPPMWETWVAKTGGLTSLLHAVREGHLESAKTLLDAGADINQVSGNGTSPLLMAILNGRFDLAMVLIERGADPNIATETDGASPLFAVLQTQWAGKTEDMPQPRAQDNEQTEYMTVLNTLLDKGANPNVRLKTHLWYWEYGTGSRLGLELAGATPFWRAAFAQDVDAMKALVAHGADPNIPTAWPPPGMRGGRQEDGRLQEDSGLPLMPEGTPNVYPIHAAAGGGWLGVGAYMVNSVPNNFLNAVKYLVEDLGVDVNLPDSWGYVPLHYASVRGGNDVIEYLVSKGADVHAISKLGQSTADMARGGNGGYFERPAYPETVDLLQRLGSDLKCVNTHFRGTGDYCPGSGAEPFEDIAGPVR